MKPEPRRQIGQFSIPESRLPAAMLRKEAIEKAMRPSVSDTPRTDALVAQCNGETVLNPNVPGSLIDLARQLEREHAALAEALQAMEDGYRSRCNFCHGSLEGCERAANIPGACRAPAARAALKSAGYL